MGKVREFGVFPMLSEERFDDDQFNAKFDLTWLLAYFNQNRTVLHSIAPTLIGRNDSRANLISFYPRKSLFSYFYREYSQDLKLLFIEFLVRLMKIIATDVGVNYTRTNAPPDIADVRTFMAELSFSPIAPGDLQALKKNQNYYNYTNLMRLSEVDQTVYKVNWTEYFLLVAPPEIHDHIIQDPLVAVPSKEYMDKINKVLNKTSPRAITNYVIVQYIVAWLPLLEKKYTDLVNWFASTIDKSITPRDRSELCFLKTKEHYKVPVLSMYARSKSTKVLRPLAEEMVVDILNALKSEIEESKWMAKEFKKTVLGKLDRLTWSLLDDDLFHNDTALDNLYSSHYALSSLPFLEMMDRLAFIRKTSEFMSLRETTHENLKAMLKQFSVMGYTINAYYSPHANNIMIPLPFLQSPFFNETFPRSFLFGSVGYVIGHEISHSLDDSGRQYDGNGVQRDWWEKKWTEEYYKRASCYLQQYGKVQIPKFNLTLNPTLTFGENTADNEGAKVAYKAYKEHLAKKVKNETVNGFTPDQLFFLGSAMIWCEKSADFRMYEQLSEDHAPSLFRVNEVYRNSPAFADAFHCSQNSKMNPKTRCSSIW